MNNKRPKQTEMILSHLQRRGSITSIEALTEYGIARCASRICELRQQGYKIESIPVQAKNRYGIKTHYTRYILIKED